MKIQVFCNTPDFNDKDCDKRNCYNFHHKYIKNYNCIGESSFNIKNFKKFIALARKETVKGDTRPIYVFNFFERLDEQRILRLSSICLPLLIDKCLWEYLIPTLLNDLRVAKYRLYNGVTNLKQKI